ncbi:hypothetical protein DMUE_3505 [Dictyocoela muelleri]|nr:hypothetical protein DMUE_3505 [Dictyocoela muelleri]
MKCEKENKIIYKTKIYCNPKIQLPPRCEDLINFNISKIKNIGIIPNVAHEIIPSNNETIQAKPFRIPLKHKEKVYALINDLLRNRIIQKAILNIYLLHFQ